MISMSRFIFESAGIFAHFDWACALSSSGYYFIKDHFPIYPGCLILTAEQNYTQPQYESRDLINLSRQDEMSIERAKIEMSLSKKFTNRQINFWRYQYSGWSVSYIVAKNNYRKPDVTNERKTQILNAAEGYLFPKRI